MSYSDLDNFDHDPKLAEALGNMVVAWARAETALLNVFACITQIHFNLATMAYYRIPTFEARTKVIQAMLKEWQSTKYDPPKIEKAVTKLAKLAATRNHWIHSVWCLSVAQSETVIFDFRAPEGHSDRRKPVKAADVVQHVAAVRKRTAELDAFVPLYFYPEDSQT